MNSAPAQKIIAVSVLVLCLIVAAVVIVLALNDPAGQAGTIATLVGMLGLAMTNLVAANRVSELDRSIKNGAVTEPVQTALASDHAQDSIKTAVHDALRERGPQQ